MGDDDTIILALQSLLIDEWIGDIIRVSDDTPNDYKLLNSISIKI